MLYARAPRPGRVKTRLTPPLSPAEAAAFHRALVIDSLAILRRAASLAAARAVVSWSEPWDCGRDRGDRELAAAARGFETLSQTPGDLGERLSGTFETLLAAGARRVVVFGSDSPTLPPRLLRRALDRLGRDADAVLGPAEDGGFYLIGAARAVPGMLEGIGWGTGTALRDARRALERARLRVADLPCWYDVDRPEDLPRLWTDLGSGRAGGASRTAAFLEEIRRSGRLRPASRSPRRGAPGAAGRDTPTG